MRGHPPVSHHPCLQLDAHEQVEAAEDRVHGDEVAGNDPRQPAPGETRARSQMLAAAPLGALRTGAPTAPSRLRLGPFPGQQPRQCGEQRPIGWPEPRPGYLPAQHSDLLARHQQFDLVADLAPPVQHDQLREAAQHPAAEGHSNPSILPDVG